MDPLRDARVSRARDHPEQRVQQGRRLVGSRGAHVRDGGRLPAFLCRPAHSDLRKDRLRAGKISQKCGEIMFSQQSHSVKVLISRCSSSQGSISRALHRRAERPPEKPATGGPDEAVRKPQERCQRHQESQVVSEHRLDRHLPEKGKQNDGINLINFTRCYKIVHEKTR